MKKWLHDIFNDSFLWFLIGILFGVILISCSYLQGGYLTW